MQTFFQSLPRRLKVVMAFFQALVACYFVTAMSVYAAVHDPRILEWVIAIAMVYMFIWPIISTLVEFLIGVPGTAPPASTTPKTPPTNGHQ